jgi:hypothetical protein
MPNANASSALERFTVLDLTRVRAGPTAVRQLADWGANVIKIELPEHLDAPEGLGGARHGPDFQNLHRNKRSMTLDLKSPAGAATFRCLAAKADVVVENFRPDVKTRLGIDYLGSITRPSAGSIRASSTPAFPASARPAPTATDRASIKSHRVSAASCPSPASQGEDRCG